MLLYPHARNNCILCREMDADFEIVEEALEPPSWTPGRPPRRFCQGCIGRWMVTQAAYGRGNQTSPGEPLRVTVTMLGPGGGSW
ncbi:hypothetical protein ACWEPC_06675 [Nonomuraea sp. NPDC004297]